MIDTFVGKTCTHVQLLAAALLGAAHHSWGLLKCKHRKTGEGGNVSTLTKKSPRVRYIGLFGAVLSTLHTVPIRPRRLHWPHVMQKQHADMDYGTAHDHDAGSPMGVIPWLILPPIPPCLGITAPCLSA